MDRLKGHKDGIVSIFSPDGPEGTIIYSYRYIIIFSASKDGGVRIWDLIERKTVLKYYMTSD